MGFEVDFAKFAKWGVIFACLATGCGGSSSGSGGSAAPTKSIPQAPLLKVMPLGDSITAGIDGNYRSIIAGDLQNSFNFKFVGSLVSPGNPRYDHHEGHGGWSVENFIGEDTSIASYPQGIASPVTYYVSNAMPDVILLLAGTNDGLCGVAEYVRRYTKFLNDIYSVDPHVKIVWAETLPRTSDPTNLLVDQAHPAILETAKAFPGKPIFVVDPSIGFDPKLDTVDGVHPNPIGNRMLASCFEGGLVSLGVINRLPSTVN